LQQHLSSNRITLSDPRAPRASSGAQTLLGYDGGETLVVLDDFESRSAQIGRNRCTGSDGRAFPTRKTDRLAYDDPLGGVLARKLDYAGDGIGIRGVDHLERPCEAGLEVGDGDAVSTLARIDPDHRPMT
jgi:hypothetical protein